MIRRENQRGRSWIYLVLTFLLASATALAGTTGNLTGYVTGPNNAPLAGVKVLASSPVLQGTRSTTTDAQGFFRITQLPPGDGYRLRFESSGYKTTERSGIVLHIDETIKVPTVRMQAQQVIEAVEVVEEAPVVEQGSTTIGRTMSSEFLSLVPSARNTTAVLQMAPGAATDAVGTTFRGASSPENNYMVDGLNTTGVLLGLDSTNLPNEFIQEIQVKTGGYEPEYGRSTGGVSSVITKSGGNEFHGDVFVYVTPFEGARNSFVNGSYSLPCPDTRVNSEGDTVPYNCPASSASPTTAYSNGFGAMVSRISQPLQLQAGFDLGGYIIKDKLWFFVGYAPEYRKRLYGHEWRLLGNPDDLNPLNRTDEQLDPSLSGDAVYDAQTRLVNYYIANVTFNINQDHSVRLSGLGNPTTLTGVQFGNFFYEPGAYMGANRAGAMDFVMTYNGKFAGGLVNLDTTIGYHRERDQDIPFKGTYTSESGNSPYEGQEIDGESANFQHVYAFNVPGGCADLSGETQDQRCFFSNFYRTGGYGGMNVTDASRFSIKPVLSIFVSNMVGNHVFKLGGDMERNRVLNLRAFTGGSLVQIRGTLGRDELGNAVYTPSTYRERYYSNFGEAVTWQGIDDETSYYRAETLTQNFSAFIQDNWNVLSNLQLNLGVRWEMQQIMDVQSVPRIVIPDMIAPRIGLIFDFTKEGKSKLFANYGRYYESIPQDINDRALSAEGFNRYQYRASEFPDYAPQAQPLTEDYLFDLLGGEISPVQVGLKGQYQDAVILGFEYEVMPNLSAGINVMRYWLGNVIEDISPDNGNTYIIANPGADSFDYYLAPEPDAEGNLPAPEPAGVTFRACFAASDPLTGAPATYCFPKATRVYRAVELTMNKRFTNNWTGQFAYTWQQTYGNYPGLFAQSRGQLDPNITSQFDLANLLVNRDGYLDTDRRHLIKFAGAYRFNFGTSIGLTANIQSGIPVLFLGAHPVYGGNEAFIIPRGAYPTDAEELAVTVEERTPWVVALDANVRHEFVFANKNRLGLGVQVNNLLNGQSPLRLDQGYTIDAASPAVGGTSLSEVQCYDTTGALYSAKVSCTPNPNYGNPVEYQAPFSVRIEAKYSF